MPWKKLSVAGAIVAGLLLATAGPAHAAGPKPGPGPAGSPVPLSLVAAIAYANCVSGGATSSDTTVANQLRSQMNGRRLGTALSAYHVS